MKHVGFTPGPWTLGKRQQDTGCEPNSCPYPAYLRRIDAPGWAGLASVWVRMEGDAEDDEYGKANARLIADAPNLLAQRDAAVEALKVARVYVHNVACLCKKQDLPGVNKDLQQIDAALAAAEGGE